MHHRMEVLGALHRIVRQWIRDESMRKNMPPNVAETVGGNIYTFGSYRLGVYNRGADIDALCVAPRHIDRSDYFRSFDELLKQQPQVYNRGADIDALCVAPRHIDRSDYFRSFYKLLKQQPQVYNRGADIDALCVAPRHIDRSDYFRSFYKLLKQQPQIKDLRAIENAFVSVIDENVVHIFAELICHYFCAYG